MLMQSRVTKEFVNFNHVFSIAIESPSSWGSNRSDEEGIYRVKAFSGGIQGENEWPTEATLYAGTEANCEKYLDYLGDQLSDAGLLLQETYEFKPDCTDTLDTKTISEVCWHHAIGLSFNQVAEAASVSVEQAKEVFSEKKDYIDWLRKQNEVSTMPHTLEQLWDMYHAKTQTERLEAASPPLPMRERILNALTTAEKEGITQVSYDALRLRSDAAPAYGEFSRVLKDLVRDGYVASDTGKNMTVLYRLPDTNLSSPD